MNETAHRRRKRRQLVVPDDQHLQRFELRNGVRKLLRMMGEEEKPQTVHTCQGTTPRVPPSESETKEPNERGSPRDTGISNSGARREWQETRTACYPLNKVSSNGLAKQTAIRGVEDEYLLRNRLQTVVAQIQYFQRRNRKARNTVNGVQHIVIQKEHLRFRNVIAGDVVTNQLNRSLQLGSSFTWVSPPFPTVDWTKERCVHPSDLWEFEGFHDDHEQWTFLWMGKSHWGNPKCSHSNHFTSFSHLPSYTRFCQMLRVFIRSFSSKSPEFYAAAMQKHQLFATIDKEAITARQWMRCREMSLTKLLRNPSLRQIPLSRSFSSGGIWGKTTFTSTRITPMCLVWPTILCSSL